MKIPINEILPTLTFLVPMAAAIWSAVRLLSKKSRRTHHIILGLAFVDLAVSMLMMVHYFRHLSGTGITLDIFSLISFLTISPLFYLYVRELTYSDGIRPVDWRIFIPGGLVVFANIVMIPILGLDGSRLYMSLYVDGVPDLSKYGEAMAVKFFLDSRLYRVVNFMQTLAIFIFCCPEIEHYKRTLELNFSDRGRSFLNPEDGVKWFSFLMVIALGIMCIFPFPMYRQFPGAMALIGLCLTGSIIALGRFASMAEGCAADYAMEDDDMQFGACTPACTTSVRQDDELAPWLNHKEKILAGLKVFIADRGYLNPNISIVELADMMDSNRLYVSEAIRQVYGESFCVFINRQRVEQAKALMVKYAGMTYTMKKIAYESGYNSFTNFYRNFTKYAGMTPSEWQDKVNEEL